MLTSTYSVDNRARDDHIAEVTRRALRSESRGWKEGSGQTSDAGSAGRRESARKNTGRNEREGAGAAGSSGVDSSVGPTNAGAVAGGTWLAVTSG